MLTYSPEGDFSRQNGSVELLVPQSFAAIITQVRIRQILNTIYVYDHIYAPHHQTKMRMFLKPTPVLVFATVAAIVLILQKNFSVAYHLRKQIARRHSSKAKRFVSKRTCERWGSDTSPGAWLTAGNTPLPCVVHRAGSIRSRSNGVGVHGVPKILSPMGPRPWIGVWLTSWKHATALHRIPC